MLAQASQPDADRRLTLPKLFGYTSDAADVVQKVEQLEQLEVGKLVWVHRTIVLRNDSIVVIELRDWTLTCIVATTSTSDDRSTIPGQPRHEKSSTFAG